MNPKLIETLTGNDTKISIYKIGDNYTLWLQIGAALLEVKEHILSELLDLMNKTSIIIETEKGDSHVRQ